MVSFSLKYKIQFQKVLVIIVTWMIIGFLIAVYDHFLLYSEIAEGGYSYYTFFSSMLVNVGAGFTSGLLYGSILVFYGSQRFRGKPYWMTILIVFLLYIVIFILVVMMIGIFIIPMMTGQSLTDPGSHDNMISYISDKGHLKNALVWGIVVALTQFMLQVNDKFGQGMLWNIIRGRYQKARREQRIFMFVDLQSSTSLAEKLGNEKYHMLLKEFFSDITDAIVYNKGEIYQYIGDEVVVSWKMEAGTSNNHCLQCYFDMRKTIIGLREKYISTYGQVPEFKAGIHYGQVIAGEIGIIKRDITYSGDVLNTASRIQSMCNELKVNLLCSDDLLSLLPYQDRFTRISLGDIELKGKEIKVSLSTVVP